MKTIQSIFSKYDIDAKLLERANLQTVKAKQRKWQNNLEAYEKQQTFIAMLKPEQINPDVQCVDIMK